MPLTSEQRKQLDKLLGDNKPPKDNASGIIAAIIIFVGFCFFKHFPRDTFDWCFIGFFCFIAFYLTSHEK